MALVPCLLTHLLRDETADNQVMLRERDGARRLSFVIGPHEALSIERLLKRLPFPRPLTHDLLAATITALGGRLAALAITGMHDGTYHAELRIIDATGAERAIDCRPSDGLAVLLLLPGADLLVADELLTVP